METTSRLSPYLSVPNARRSHSRSLDTGAITSPMAVSFREEKLALRFNSMNGSRSDLTLSASADGDRK